MGERVKAWISQIKLREADSARLDWLEANRPPVLRTHDPAGWFVGLVTAETLRGAIDAARAAGEGAT